MKLSSAKNHTLLLFAIAFNLLIVLFLVSSYTSDDTVTSVPNVPDESYLSPNSIDEWFDADALTQYRFWQGMENGDKISDWKVSTVNLYFPNISLFGISYFTFKNPGLSLLGYVLVQFGAILLLFSWLAKQLSLKYRHESAIVAVLLLSIFGLSPLYGPDLHFFYNILMPFHSGMFVTVLLSLVFFFKSIDGNSKVHIPLLSASVILATISNSLYHVYFTFPVVLVSLFALIKEPSIYIRPLITIFASVGAGLLLTNILPDLAITVPLTGDRWQSYKMLEYTMLNLFNSSLLMRIILTVYALTFIYSVAVSAHALYKIITTKIYSISRHQLFQMIFAATAIASFAAPVVAGNFVGIYCIRYVLYSIMIGVFNAVVVLTYYADKYDRRLITYPMYAMLLGALLYVSIRGSKQNPFGAFERVKNFNNSIAVATDSLSKKYALKNGIADFWDAGPISVFSKQNIKVVHTYFDLALWWHASNATAIKRDSIGQPSVFNFVALRRWNDTTQLCAFFGDSIVRVTEGGHRFYLVPEFQYNTELHPVLTGKFDFAEELKRMTDN